MSDDKYSMQINEQEFAFQPGQSILQAADAIDFYIPHVCYHPNLVDDPGAPAKQMGIWSMAKALRDPEVKSSITLLLNFLRGMGDRLKQNQTH